MNQSVVQKVNQTSSSSSQKILHEGSSVNVRILSQKNNGTYVGTVAGVRVNLHSTKALLLNQSFPATVSIKNGIIYVTPKGSENTLSIENQTSLKALQAEAIAQRLNLPFDSLMAEIIDFAKQMEMKLESSMLLKVKNLAIRYKGKELSAAKLLLILLQKKIELSEVEINAILDFLDDDFEQSQNQRAFRENENDSLKKALNKFNKEKGFWYIIPFELVNLSNQEILAKGNAKLFYSANEKLKLLNLECIKSGKKFIGIEDEKPLNNEIDKNNVASKYYFSLLFENDKCSKIRFSSDANISSLMKEKFLKIGLEVEEVSKSEIEGFNGYEDTYISFEGEV